MTTRAEIRRWVGPFVASRSDVALLPRAVILAPVRHIACGMAFRSSRDKAWPDISWVLEILFAAPGSLNAQFERRLYLGGSITADFPQKLDRAMRESFDQVLVPSRSIADFHDFAVGEDQHFTFRNLDDYPLEHATVLAALGRLDKAEAMLRATVADYEEAAKAEQRADDEFRNARPRPRGVIILDAARRRMPAVQRLLALLALIESRDRPAIGNLLRDWERERVSQREIEHLWEPMPYPVELDGA